MSTDLAPTDFDAVFAAFAASPTSTSVFRWEALQRYEVASDEPSLVAFREGTPRPERSVRTSPWLARIATSTLAGKDWRRVRHVVEPLSEYLRWELLAYVESQSAGEQITVHTSPDIPAAPDFWLFDGAPSDQCAVLMHYDADGAPHRYELLEHDAPQYAELAEVRDQVSAAAVPLNRFLAAREVRADAA